MDFDDIVKIVDQVKVLEARLAAVEAKRDAATKKAEQLLLSRYFTRCREGAFDHSTDCATWGDDGQGNVDGKPVHPPCNCGASWNWAKQMEAERDAARAGETRAVEALDVFARAYQVSMLPFAPGIDEADGAHHGWPSVADLEQANTALTDSSALDWLARQRREAAVEALEKLATDLGQVPWGSALHDVDWLRGILRARAAEIRAGEVGDE